MDHFPCITDAEFRRACAAFHNQVIASQNGISNFESRYDAKTLSIQKLYPSPRAREVEILVEPFPFQNGDDSTMIDEIEDREEVCLTLPTSDATDQPSSFHKTSRTIDQDPSRSAFPSSILQSIKCQSCGSALIDLSLDTITGSISYIRPSCRKHNVPVCAALG